MFEPVSYRLGMADYLRFNRAICAGSMGKSLGITLAIVGGFIAVASWLSGNGLDLMPAVAGGIAGGLFFLFYLYFLLPRKAGILFREQRSLSEEMTLTLKAEGFEVQQASGNFRAEWQHLVKWTAPSGAIIVFPSRNVMIWFTEQAIGVDRLEYIKDRLIESGLPAPGKLRK